MYMYVCFPVAISAALARAPCICQYGPKLRWKARRASWPGLIIICLSHSFVRFIFEGLIAVTIVSRHLRSASCHLHLRLHPKRGNGVRRELVLGGDQSDQTDQPCSEESGLLPGGMWWCVVCGVLGCRPDVGGGCGVVGAMRGA